jgi:hypothetical protein
MKILITALAVTAILATSAVAKAPRPKEVRVQHNTFVSHNAVSRSSTQINTIPVAESVATLVPRRTWSADGRHHTDCRFSFAASPPSGCAMTDRSSRMEQNRKEAEKFSDLAKAASSPFLRAYYWHTALRYLSSDGELSVGQGDSSTAF